MQAQCSGTASVHGRFICFSQLFLELSDDVKTRDLMSF